jgi:hypothetical protein
MFFATFRYFYHKKEHIPGLLSELIFSSKVDPSYSAILTTEMPDCPASCQSGTGLEKANDAGSGPVPE